jgi:hypothetical protein
LLSDEDFGPSIFAFISVFPGALFLFALGDVVRFLPDLSWSEALPVLFPLSLALAYGGGCVIGGLVYALGQGISALKTRPNEDPPDPDQPPSRLR